MEQNSDELMFEKPYVFFLIFQGSNENAWTVNNENEQQTKKPTSALVSPLVGWGLGW